MDIEVLNLNTSKGLQNPKQRDFFYQKKITDIKTIDIGLDSIKYFQNLRNDNKLKPSNNGRIPTIIEEDSVNISGEKNSSYKKTEYSAKKESKEKNKNFFSHRRAYSNNSEELKEIKSARNIKNIQNNKILDKNLNLLKNPINKVS